MLFYAHQILSGGSDDRAMVRHGGGSSTKELPRCRCNPRCMFCGAVSAISFIICVLQCCLCNPMCVLRGAVFTILFIVCVLQCCFGNPMCVWRGAAFAISWCLTVLSWQSHVCFAVLSLQSHLLCFAVLSLQSHLCLLFAVLSLRSHLCLLQCCLCVIPFVFCSAVFAIPFVCLQVQSAAVLCVIFLHIRTWPIGMFLGLQ